MDSKLKVKRKIKVETPEDEEMDLFCNYCGTQFRNKQRTQRHSNICKFNPKSNRKRVTCYYCDKSFSRKDTLVGHISTCCLKSNKIDFKRYKFNSKEEFQMWKDEEEIRTMSYFSKRCGMKNSKEYYYCQHHGSDKPHRKKNEPDRLTSRRKTIGVIKKNIICPAKIVLKQRSNIDYEVDYCSTHSHELSEKDLAHQPVTFTTNILIQKQLDLNVPPKEILNKLQSVVLCQDSKKGTKFVRPVRNSVTPKAIQLRMFKMKNQLRYIQDDSKIVDEIILKQEKYSKIILYKPLDKDIQIGPENMKCLSREIENLYMIGMQTKTQRDLLIEGANKVLIIDTTQFKYMNVLTVMIIDEHSLAWPVGHFLSNSMSSEVVNYFVRTLKYHVLQKTGQRYFQVNCLITNDKSFLIDGFTKGFDYDINHTILCQYHFNETIQRNIREYADSNMFTNLYEKLKAIISTQNEEEFQYLYESFLDNHEHDAQKFIEFFKINYSSRIEQWAMCFRFYMGHGNINTIVHVESFHNRLKSLLSNDRIDNLVNTLINIEKTNASIRNRLENNLSFEKYENSKRRHELSIEIPDNYIVQINSFLWKIKSETFSNTYYYIEKINEICCAMDCKDICSISSCRNVCIHLYKCSCSDKIPLCKHIHKIHSKLLRGQYKDQEAQFHYVYVTDETVRESASEEMAYERIRLNLSKLFQILEEKSLPSHLLYSTDTMLEQFVKTMDAEVKVKSEISCCEEEEAMELS